MTGHRIALAILLVVGVACWAGVNLVVGPALLGRASADRAGARDGDPRAAGAPRVGAPAGAASSPHQPEVAPVTSVAALAGAGAEAAASAAIGEAAAASSAAASAAAPVAAPEPAMRLAFAARSPNFEPGTRMAIFELVRRLRGEPERRVRLVGRGDPGSDGAAAESLATRRAQGAREFLVTLGISADRVTAEAAPASEAVAGGAGGDEGRTVDVFLE